MREASDRGLTVLLAALTAMMPLAMQIFLPALPIIGEDLGASAEVTQLTFSVFVFALGPAQLLYGPVADRLGRRTTALIGMAICLAGSIGCAFAPDIYWLIGARLVQAIGGASGIVVTRAILSDRYGQDQMASRLSSVIIVIVVVPMIAPVVGGYLTVWFGWRSMFHVVSAVVLMTLLATLLRLPETLGPGGREARGFRPALRVLSRKPLFYVYTLQTSMALAVFYAFIAVVPFLMVAVLDRPPTEYGLYFIVLTSGYLAGNVFSSRYADGIGIDRMIMIGSSVGLTGAVAMTGLTLAGFWHPAALFGPMTLLAVSNGIASPSMQSGAVSQSPEHAGSASGLVGFTQQMLAAFAAQGVAMVSSESPVPMALTILCASALIFGAAVYLQLAAAPARSGAPAHADD